MSIGLDRILVFVWRQMLSKDLQVFIIALCVFFAFQLYNFGETVSIVFWTDEWRPESFYDKIASNRERGMHTLCLLGESLFLVFFYLYFHISYNVGES